MPNLFNHLPPTGSDHEVFNELLSSPSVRIERIVSTGQSSPSGFWYDQSEIEWIALLQGRARLAVEESEGVTLVELGPGDYYLLPAHCRHRVEWTDPEQPTIWLAIFFPATAPNQPEGTI